MSEKKNVGAIEQLIESAESVCSLIKRIADKGTSADTLAAMGGAMQAATQALDFASKHAGDHSESARNIYELLNGTKSLK